MDITRSQNLTPPGIIAHYAPVYWEPLPGSGERICAIVLLAPEPNSQILISPGAHVVINAKRLRAMLGVERGSSAAGILKEAADFMTRRLLVSANLQEALPPFKHFTVGRARQVRGFTAEQVLDAAVHMVSAFGSTDDLLDELTENNNHSTATTREFLARVQTAFAPSDDERRKRFLRKVDTAAGEVTIDYVFNRHLVQFATAPISDRQAHNMRREAEAKMLETLTVRQTVMQNQADSRLLINTAPIMVGGLSNEALDLAHATMAHYASMADIHGFLTTEVSSHEDAVHALMALA